MKNDFLQSLRRIASPLVLLSDGSLAHNGLIEISPLGEIVDVRCNVEQLDRTAGLEYYNGILIPGMVNAHCHLELSFFEGQIPQGTGLVEFIRQVVGRRPDFDRPTQLTAAAKHDVAMWQRGIQAVGDISNGDVSFDSKVGSKIAYHTYAEYFGTPTPTGAAAAYQAQTAHVELGRDRGLSVTPTPHSTYLVSEALFPLAAHVRGGIGPRLSIHFMETLSELELFDSRGGMYNFMMESSMVPDFLSHGSHARRLVDCLPADIPLLLIHNTQIKREDVELIMSHFTDVTFVLCPLSNHYIERGFPPATLLRDMGCRIALGTDSLSSNTTLDIAKEIGWLWVNNPTLPLTTILSWATAGGAAALGMPGLGSFKVGTTPGVVLLEGMDLARLTPTSDITAKRLV